MDMQIIMTKLATFGREREQQALMHKIEQFRRGKGGVVLLESSQEVGENLLVRHFLGQIEETCYYGVCQPHPFLVPYDVFRQIFPEFFQKFRSEISQRFEAALGAFSTGMYQGILGKIARKVSKGEKQSMLLCDAIDLHVEFAEFLKEKITPAIFYIEDVHWADLASFKLIEFLTHAFREKPVLFIFSAIPEMLDSPDLPLEMRDANIPVIQQLQAVQLIGNLPLSPKGRRDYVDDIGRIGEKIRVNPLENETLINFIKKIIGSAMPDYLLTQIVRLCRGNTLFLGQFLFYLLENVLSVENGKWQLKCEPHEVDIPKHLEIILQSNTENMDSVALDVLKCAAVYGKAVPTASCAKLIDREDISDIIKEGTSQGLISYIETTGLIVFNTYVQRDTILQQTSTSDRRQIHQAWSVLAEVEQNSFRLAYHMEHGDDSSTTLEKLLTAGIDAEMMLAYEEAYHYYRKASELFAEIKDAFLINLKELQKKLEEKDKTIKDDLPKFLDGFRYYRISALVGANDLFSIEYRNLMKKVVYLESPVFFFPTLASLTIYLVKVFQVDKKPYPHGDILFLLDLVSNHLLPGRDYNSRLLFWKPLARQKALPAKKRMAIVRYQEKWGNSLDAIDEKCIKYLEAAYFARLLEDYFEAARILYKIIKLCQKQIVERPELCQYQIEALRFLAMIYEKRAAKEDDDETKIKFASQAALAYQDAVMRLWQFREASWLAQKLMEKSSTLCENYFLENDIIEETLETARVKRELAQEKEYRAKALIIAGEEDFGAVDLLEDHLCEQDLQCELYPVLPPDMAFELSAEGFLCSFLLVSPHTTFWQKSLAYLQAGLVFGYSKGPGEGWFVYESKEHACFVLSANNSAELYRITLDFCSEKFLRSYI